MKWPPSVCCLSLYFAFFLKTRLCCFQLSSHLAIPSLLSLTLKPAWVGSDHRLSLLCVRESHKGEAVCFCVYTPPVGSYKNFQHSLLVVDRPFQSVREDRRPHGAVIWLNKQWCSEWYLLQETPGTAEINLILWTSEGSIHLRQQPPLRQPAGILSSDFWRRRQTTGIKHHRTEREKGLVNASRTVLKVRSHICFVTTNRDFTVSHGCLTAVTRSEDVLDEVVKIHRGTPLWQIQLHSSL